MKYSTRKMAIAILFGVVVFVSKALVPTPIDKMFVVIQSLMLSLGFLTALLRAPFAPFSLGLALIYGLIVDAPCNMLKVKTPEGDVKILRLTISLATSTALVGLVSYIVTAYMFRLVPRNLVLEVSILIAGIISGAVGGYLASVIWRRYLRYQH